EARLDDESARRVSEHLDTCRECIQKAAALCPDSALAATIHDRLERVRSSERPSPATTVADQQQPLREDKGQSTIVGLANDVLSELVNHPDYEIRRELGRGGMGVVYLAYNRLMGRNEVLKVMGRHIIERPGVMERFLREIRAVAQLRHPNIVTA